MLFIFILIEVDFLDTRSYFLSVIERSSNDCQKTKAKHLQSQSEVQAITTFLANHVNKNPLFNKPTTCKSKPMT